MKTNIYFKFKIQSHTVSTPPIRNSDMKATTSSSFKLNFWCLSKYWPKIVCFWMLSLTFSNSSHASCINFLISLQWREIYLFWIFKRNKTGFYFTVPVKKSSGLFKFFPIICGINFPQRRRKSQSASIHGKLLDRPDKLGDVFLAC